MQPLLPTLVRDQWFATPSRPPAPRPQVAEVRRIAVPRHAIARPVLARGA
ncbi:hypothetical protein ACQEVB_26395 [Pseudonocardia sp. CA-107938]